MEDIKTIIIVSLSSLAAYLSPINNILIAVVLAFILNFFAGYLAGMIAKNEKFNIKKAFVCIKESTIFFMLVSSIFFIGDHLGNRDEALTSITIITYVLLYFYAVNILKNLMILLPDSRWLAFIYWAISFEYVKKVPMLEKFLNHEKNT